ncbi:MAG: carboxymuconolactone decarboxylase family protein [Gammaproteobacteria bacterium]|nr:carboxymuconolactone decarboxylase family protein [Gammaproteobacteria bacterium]MCZ6855569.1 carboxymuconolactone decarboxylase family protein [Gammaproteobacteria bacterium]
MTQFNVYDENTAPVESQTILARVRKSLGFLPNLFGVLAEAPTAVEAYGTLNELFMRSSFTPQERHVVWFANIYENDCTYCMAAHTGIANLEKVPEEVIEAARSGKPYADNRLEALRQFTRSVVVNRGWVSDEELETFLAAGFNRQHVLEVVVGVAHKVISTYTNHIAKTPLDAAFKRNTWQKPEYLAEVS